MEVIAHIETDFDDKFGIPRQSGLVPELAGRIVFEPAYRDASAVRGLEDYSYLWLLWQFSEVPEGKWSPTVRPPRLGGNKRVGVFATRSPFRPNPIGLSSVKIAGIYPETPDGPVIEVSGADLMDGTPIYDIKPYLPHIDCHSDAESGFSGTFRDYGLTVDCNAKLLAKVPAEKRQALLGVLSQDPRPGYQHDAERIYGIHFAGFNVQFKVTAETLIVTALETVKKGHHEQITK